MKNNRIAERMKKTAMFDYRSAFKSFVFDTIAENGIINNDIIGYHYDIKDALREDKHIDKDDLAGKMIQAFITNENGLLRVGETYYVEPSNQREFMIYLFSDSNGNELPEDKWELLTSDKWNFLFEHSIRTNQRGFRENIGKSGIHIRFETEAKLINKNPIVFDVIGNDFTADNGDTLGDDGIYIRMIDDYFNLMFEGTDSKSLYKIEFPLFDVEQLFDDAIEYANDIVKDIEEEIEKEGLLLDKVYEIFKDFGKDVDRRDLEKLVKWFIIK